MPPFPVYIKDCTGAVQPLVYFDFLDFHVTPVTHDTARALVAGLNVSRGAHVSEPLFGLAFGNHANTFRDGSQYKWVFFVLSFSGVQSFDKALALSVVHFRLRAAMTFSASFVVRASGR